MEQSVVIGIDIGGTTVKLGAVQDRKKIIYRDEQPSVHDADGLTTLLKDMILKARRLYPNAPCGISTAGAILPGGALTANQFGFVEAPVGRLLSEKLGFDVPMENDGICAMMAEYAAGALMDCTSTGIMITLGTGVGGAVLADGHVLRGFGGINLELGHMLTHVDGKACSCGQRGCWEAYASCSALSEMAGGMRPQEILEHVKNGEMTDLWQRYTHEVAQGLISLCSIFYPEIIVIGGGLSNAGSIVIDSIRSEFEKDPGFGLYYSHVLIRQAFHRNDAGILGAATIAVR